MFQVTPNPLFKYEAHLLFVVPALAWFLIGGSDFDGNTGLIAVCGLLLPIIPLWPSAWFNGSLKWLSLANAVSRFALVWWLQSFGWQELSIYLSVLLFINGLFASMQVAAVEHSKANSNFYSSVNIWSILALAAFGSTLFWGFPFLIGGIIQAFGFFAKDLNAQPSESHTSQGKICFLLTGIFLGLSLLDQSSAGNPDYASHWMVLLCVWLMAWLFTRQRIAVSQSVLGVVFALLAIFVALGGDWMFGISFAIPCVIAMGLLIANLQRQTLQLSSATIAWGVVLSQGVHARPLPGWILVAIVCVVLFLKSARQQTTV